MSEAANKAVVRRYFDEVLDGGDRSVMRELFAEEAAQHFPGRDLTFESVPPGREFPNRRFRTTLHHLLADGDFVLAHLTHHVTFGQGERWPTRLGPIEAGGHSVSWDAMALFHLKDGRIDEEWVSRDELDVLSQLGAVTLTPMS